MTTPIVSVLVPTYKYAHYLPEALDSILSQDLEDFELIVADDRSDDGTDEVLARYERRDERVRGCIRPERLGMVQNWNQCLREARGRYIRYVFADDRLATTHALSRMVAVLDENPRVSLVACAREIIDADGRPTNVRGFGPRTTIKPGPDVMADWLSHLGNRIGEPTAVMFRRADAERGFDPAYSQLVDFEMWMHLLQRGDFAYVAECLCSFRRHESQQTEKNRIDGVSEREHVLLLDTYGRTLLDTSPRHVLFELSYRVGKLKPSPSKDKLQRLVRERWAGKRWTYPFQYLRYKIRRPFENLYRSIWQRALRRSALAR